MDYSDLNVHQSQRGVPWTFPTSSQIHATVANEARGIATWPSEEICPYPPYLGQYLSTVSTGPATHGACFPNNSELAPIAESVRSVRGGDGRLPILADAPVNHRYGKPKTFFDRLAFSITLITPVGPVDVAVCNVTGAGCINVEIAYSLCIGLVDFRDIVRRFLTIPMDHAFLADWQRWGPPAENARSRPEKRSPRLPATNGSER